MSRRIYSGSLMGLSRDRLHSVSSNPYCRIILDEKIDEARLEKALEKALDDCPYMRYTLTPDEGVFLKLEENNAPFPLLKEEPAEINAAENNGHSAAVYCRDNTLGVMVSHALTDGCGILWFARTILDHYFGESDGIYRGAKEPDYDRDPLEEEIPKPASDVRTKAAEGPVFSLQMPDKPDRKGFFVLKTSYQDFRALCKDIDGSAQNTLTMLGMRACTEAWPENEKRVGVRLPINARNVFGVPNTFHNASFADIRVSLEPDDLKDADDRTLVRMISDQASLQKNPDNVYSQFLSWKEVLLAPDRDERLKRIASVMGQETFMISNLGHGLIGEAYASHVKAVFTGAIAFPLMVYGIGAGDKLFCTGLEATGTGAYRDALKTVLERRGFEVEELDPETGKTV